MKLNITLIVVSLLLIFTSGCEDLNNPGEVKTKNSILYQLRINAPKQQLLIYRIVGISELKSDSSADMYCNFFNRNAEVTLKDLQSGQSTGFMLTQDTMELFPGSGITNPYKAFYSNSGTFNPKPAADYLLSVKTSGEVITGRVTTPGDFEINAPKKGEVIRGFQNFRKYIIKWDKSKNAVGYFVKATCTSSYNLGTNEDPSYIIGGISDISGDTSCQLNSILKVWADLIASGDCTIQIEAYDNNYVQHYRNMKESVGLDGAYGCFSSSLIKEVRFRYFKD